MILSSAEFQVPIQFAYEFGDKTKCKVSVLGNHYSYDIQQISIGAFLAHVTSALVFTIPYIIYLCHSLRLPWNMQ